MLDDILQQQYFIELELGQLNDAQMQSARDDLERLQAVRADYIEAREHIIDNDDLSTEGKTKKLVTLGQEIYDRMERVVNIGALERRIAETRLLEIVKQHILNQ